VTKSFIKWPPPGSTEALADGCLCPVDDNAHGRGQTSPQGDAAHYWINVTCPIHKTLTKEE
jgi:hypothetical protein